MVKFLYRLVITHPISAHYIQRAQKKQKVTTQRHQLNHLIRYVPKSLRLWYIACTTVHSTY